MKNLLILVVLLSLITFSACSQKNPPENVKKEFSQKYAAAKSVKWDSEKPNEWEAEFKIDGKEMSACFDDSGKWLESEAEVSAKELPAAVANTLKNEFSGYKTKESSTIENPEMKGYEFALKNKKTEISVIIGADGTVLKKESEDENKEEAVNEKDEKNENESDEAGEEKELKTQKKIITIKVNIGADGTVLKRESADENKEEAVKEKDEKNENASAKAGEKKELKTQEKIITIKVIISTDGTVSTRESADENKEEAVTDKDEKNENTSAKAGEKKELQTPEKIIAAFNQKFPGATSVKWGSENANEWEAEFNINGKKMSACFDGSAVWTVTETVISEKELPAVVINTLKAEFAGYKKDLIEIYESPEIKGFELTLKKGESSIEVIFDNGGKVIKKTNASEENGKD